MEVPEDYVQAYAWCNIAAAQGKDEAERDKELIAERMTHRQRAWAQQLARQYWKAYVLPFRNCRGVDKRRGYPKLPSLSGTFPGGAFCAQRRQIRPLMMDYRKL